MAEGSLGSETWRGSVEGLRKLAGRSPLRLPPAALLSPQHCERSLTGILTLTDCNIAYSEVEQMVNLARVGNQTHMMVCVTASAISNSKTKFKSTVHFILNEDW